jgi:hypothetical protein
VKGESLVMMGSKERAFAPLINLSLARLCTFPTQ